MNRRSFIKSTGIASLGLSLKIDKTFSQSDNSSVDPLVIATWDVKKATKKAWEIISSNGNSLDAIEQGCMIEEANKDGQSVGIGGLPDREGNVTLDACIIGPLRKLWFRCLSKRYKTCNFGCKNGNGKNSSCYVSWRWSEKICNFYGV